MKQLIHAVRTYKLLAFAVTSLIAALILTALKLVLIAHIVLTTVSVIAIIPLIGHIWSDIRNGTYGVPALPATAIVAAVVLRQYWAAIAVVIVVAGSELVAVLGMRQARRETRDLLSHEPHIAHILRKHTTVDVAIDALSVQDRIVIRPGDIVPVDAVVLEGTGTCDESWLTGDHTLIVKQVGDHVISGSVQTDGTIIAKTIHESKDSQYQQIVRIVRGAGEHPAPFVRFADRYTIPFSIGAYAIAGVAWIVSHHAIRFLDVIIVATPAPLILAVPLALIAGMSRASRDGIIIKSGTALEQLATAQTLAFDKTATLTLGTPMVDTIITFKSFTQEDVLIAAASLGKRSGHILAQAAVAEARKQTYKLFKAKHVQETADYGFEAHVGNQHILVGTMDHMATHSIPKPAGFKPARISQPTLLVAIDGTLAGYITFTDTLRPDTKAAFKQLVRLGVPYTLMLTSDHHTVAKTLARQLQITTVQASSSISAKLRSIEAVTDRPVAFVGNGITDGPLITASDIGIVIGAQYDTSTGEAAGVMVMRDTVADVALAVAIAKRTFRIAMQSIYIGLALELLLMLGFATGRFPAVIGAIMQGAVLVAITCIALRAHGNTRSLRPSTR